MTWLRHGVPVTLLADLVEPDGPRSREIYAAEAAYDDVRRDAQSLARAAVEAPRCTTPGAADQDFSAARTA
jgi:hypothetical protein